MLRTDTTDGVLTVTLARPERRNAIDGELAAALREAFEAAADDASVRAVILTGEGSAFSRRRRPLALRARLGPARVPPRLAPADLADHPARAAGEADRRRDQRRRDRRRHAARARLRRPPGGRSARFIYREGRLGIIPSHGGVTRLVKLIGLARARDVLLGGEELSAEEAHRVGPGHRGGRRRRVLDAARARVALMLERSPQAYAAAKRLLWLAANVDLESGMVAEGLAQSLLIGTDEHKQAVKEVRQR